MKRFFAFFLCLILCFCFASCSRENDDAKLSVNSTEVLSQTISTETNTTPYSSSPALSSEVVSSSENLTQPSTSVAFSAESTTQPGSEEMQQYVTLTIDCSNILKNMENFSPDKKDFVPQSGKIYQSRVLYNQGDTAFDILKFACDNNSCNDPNCRYCSNGIQLDYSFTPAYKTYYVRGIHQLYEFDGGSMSGWLYSVNGIFPDVGSSSYPVQNGDEILFTYSCESGGDIS